MAKRNIIDLTKQLPGAVTGQGSIGYNPQFGGIPTVADPLASQAKAVTGNLTNLGGVSDLTGRLNALNFGQYTGRLPGYSDMASASSGNILANLRGEVSEDVVNLLGQQAAERGVSSGVPGSQLSNTDFLRSLGLTSLDLKNRGEQQFSGALDRVGKAPLFDPSQFLVSPGTVQESQQQANVLGAAPIPFLQQQAELDTARIPFLNQARADASQRWQQEKERLGTLGVGNKFAARF